MILTKFTCSEVLFALMRTIPNKNEHTCDRETQPLIVIIIHSSCNYIRQRKSHVSFENPVPGDRKRTEEPFGLCDIQPLTIFPVSVSVSSGIIPVFLVIGTAAKYRYSIVLQIVNLVKN